MQSNEKITPQFRTSDQPFDLGWIGTWPNGAGDIDFDYYLVVAYDSYEQLGKAFEAYANGGGWQKIQGLLSGVAECDNPRLYDGRLVRDGTGTNSFK